MLTYKLIFQENGVLWYAFYPEGDETAAGIVEFVNGEPTRIVQESKNDFGHRYAYHAYYGIDLTRETGTIAWY